jgi:transcriptional regulator with XRE-family HTH domain
MILATKLQELRRKRGESLQQVADAVGISKAHVWSLERGEADNPSIQLLRKLADHFHVTVAFFNDEEAEPDDETARQFFREFGELSESDWELLRSLAKGLKGRTR